MGITKNMKKWHKVIVILTGIIIIALFLRHQSKIDMCFDRGGVWDSDNNQCSENEFQSQMNACYLADGVWNQSEKKCEIE